MRVDNDNVGLKMWTVTRIMERYLDKWFCF